jgi:hypothetical protein
LIRLADLGCITDWYHGAVLHLVVCARYLDDEAEEQEDEERAVGLDVEHVLWPQGLTTWLKHPYDTNKRPFWDLGKTKGQRQPGLAIGSKGHLAGDDSFTGLIGAVEQVRQTDTAE